MALEPTIIEYALAAWLQNLAVCQAVNAQVYPWARAPQDTATRPFILYHRIGGGRLRSLTGPSGTSHPKIQIDVIGRDYVAVRTLAAQIREALDAIPYGYVMTYTANGGGSITLQVAMTDDDVDQADGGVRPEHGDEYATEHRATVTVCIWFVEP